MKKSLIASLLAIASLSSFASDYYVVVPVKGRTPATTQPAISVSLNSYTLPEAVVGLSYSADLSPLLVVTGDSSYSGTGVSWSTVSSTLPGGLTLNANGTITGTPTASGTGSLTARATYKTASGVQTYQVVALNLTVAMTNASLPSAKVNTAYTGFDFKPLVSVSGDSAYSSSGLVFSLQGNLPAGMSFSNTGVLSGTPTAGVTSNFQVSAAYKGKSASQSYSLAVGADIVLQAGGYRTWSDGSVASSCQAYRNPAGAFQYAGATGDGTYRINVSGTNYDVYCDMTTDGGGWTLAAKNSPTSGERRTFFVANTGTLLGTLANLSNGGARLPFSAINTLFQNAGGTAMYKNNGTPYVYYKRLTSPSTYDFASAFFTWRSDLAGALNTDFKLFSSLASMNANTSAWNSCNFDVNVSFPRDCGPSGAVVSKWFSYDLANTYVMATLWIR